MGQRTPPVKEGEEYNLEIESEGAKGDGIGKIIGYTIFVPGAKQGDKVTVKISKVLPKFAFAEIIK